MAGKIVSVNFAQLVTTDVVMLRKVTWRPNASFNNITVVDSAGNIIIRDTVSPFASINAVHARDYNFRGGGFQVKGINVSSMSPLTYATFFIF